MTLGEKYIFGAGLRFAHPGYLTSVTNGEKSLFGTSSRESEAFGIPFLGVVSFSYTTGFRAEHRQLRLPTSAAKTREEQLE